MPVCDDPVKPIPEGHGQGFSRFHWMGRLVDGRFELADHLADRIESGLPEGF